MKEILTSQSKYGLSARNIRRQRQKTAFVPDFTIKSLQGATENGTEITVSQENWFSSKAWNNQTTTTYNSGRAAAGKVEDVCNTRKQAKLISVDQENGQLWNRKQLGAIQILSADTYKKSWLDRAMSTVNSQSHYLLAKEIFT